MSWPTFNRLDDVPEQTSTPEWHSVIGISLGELYEDGWFDPDDDSWKWDYYDEDQYDRVCEKFLNRYFWYDISMQPLLQFKMEYKRKMNEIMPKYKLLYKALDDGDINLLSNTLKYGKYREMFSEFPQTQLAGNEDYADRGHDKEYEDIEIGNILDKYAKLKNYDDVDVLILDDLKYLFSSLLSVSGNWL